MSSQEETNLYRRISRCAASLRNYRQVDDEFGHALRSYVKSALDTVNKQPPSTRAKTRKLLRKSENSNSRRAAAFNAWVAIIPKSYKASCGGNRMEASPAT